MKEREWWLRLKILASRTLASDRIPEVASESDTRRWRMARLGIAAALAVAVVCGWIGWRTRADGRLHLIVPALPGDAMLVITPHGRTIVIDGGQDAVGITGFVGERLPFWRRSIDALVLTRADGDHLPGALALARRYAVGRAILPRMPADAPLAALSDALLEESASLRIARPGDTLAIDGVTLTILAPANRDGGLAVALRYGAFTAILAPAAADAQAAALLHSPLAATAIWWPWHRPDDRRLAEHAAAAAVIYSDSPGEHDRPRSLFDRGSGDRRLLHEDLNGTIELITDGAQLQITAER